MATTNYYTFEGEIVAEDQPGGTGFRSYGPDALGSVIATYDGTGSLQNTYRYSPYGIIIASSGAATDPAFRWAGSLGYRNDARKFFEYYVRARYYSSLLASWTAIDQLWPGQMQYEYSYGNPASLTDRRGLIAERKADIPCLGWYAPFSTGNVTCAAVTIDIPIGFGFAIHIEFQSCTQCYGGCELTSKYCEKAVGCISVSGGIGASWSPTLKFLDELLENSQAMNNLFNNVVQNLQAVLTGGAGCFQQTTGCFAVENSESLAICFNMCLIGTAFSWCYDGKFEEPSITSTFCGLPSFVLEGTVNKLMCSTS